MNALTFAFLLALASGAVPRGAPAAPSGDAAPAGDSATAPDLSDEELATRVDTYLSTIDTPVRAVQWKALGPRAVPVLVAVVEDPSALPSRRARAVGALSVIGGDRARQAVLDTARSERQPYGVRASALRGAARLLPAGELARELQPVMESARQPEVRATAAEVLARHAAAASCGAVRAQAARERARDRKAFTSAVDSCAATAR